MVYGGGAMEMIMSKAVLEAAALEQGPPTGVSCGPKYNENFMSDYNFVKFTIPKIET